VEYFHALYARFFLDHRVTISDVVYAGPTSDVWTHFDSLYGPLMNGTAQTTLVGARLTGIRYSGSDTSTTQMGWWVNHFRAQGWLDRMFYYHCDEPPAGCSWSTALTEENRVHS